MGQHISVNIREAGGVHVVELSGELDANTSPLAQQQILPLAREGSRILLDMGGVTFMSSAGLRLLLMTYRQVTAHKGTVALAGLSEDLKDTMSMTGFLSFFTIHDSTESGLQAMQARG
jgi:anti-sigma B factor antagonist